MKFLRCECCNFLAIIPDHDEHEGLICPFCHRAKCMHGGKFIHISKRDFLIEMENEVEKKDKKSKVYKKNQWYKVNKNDINGENFAVCMENGKVYFFPTLQESLLNAGDVYNEEVLTEIDPPIMIDMSKLTKNQCIYLTDCDSGNNWCSEMEDICIFNVVKCKKYTINPGKDLQDTEKKPPKESAKFLLTTLIETEMIKLSIRWSCDELQADAFTKQWSSKKFIESLKELLIFHYQKEHNVDISYLNRDHNEIKEEIK